MILLVTFLLFSCQVKYTPTDLKKDLHHAWRFGKVNSDTLYPASVPGCVHLDLMANGMIEDPFYGDNEERVQWIENEDWIYLSSFTVDDSLLCFPKIDLVFEGLDTYAEVYLNDALVLEADNMFRRWITPVKQLLVKGENTLKVIFRSPVRLNQEKASTVPYKLPDERAWSRKAPYQFGWDWGPRLVTSGIWRPAYLYAWKEYHLQNLHISTESVSDEKAAMDATVEIESADYNKIEFDIKVNGKSLEKKEMEVRPGTNLVKLSFEVKKPRLWWTNGLGDPYLYDVEVIATDNKRHSDQLADRFGIRELEVVQETDSIGKSFYFRLNGKPLFMKGANYIPQDNFPSRVSENRYRTLVARAVDANMNMLRLWGGGIYEEDVFYDLCDENGILVWQDFIFACTMYPGDSAFLENVKNEAIDNIKRLRNHPCIALWCGNNEVDEGWHNWGWQKQLGYTEDDSVAVWKAYADLFHGILPGVVKDYDRQRFYWPSSPSIGWGHSESLQMGDSHYWGVWWGEQPFKIYEMKIGRFMSEYGFQGFPDLETIQSFTEPEDRHLESLVLNIHQKHPRGMELIRTYMERDFKVPDNFEDYTYVSQLLQAEGIRTAIEAHRRAMPYCMGTLYWQFNDCWPVISWSSMDYYYRPKALHFKVKQAFSDLLISFGNDEEKTDIYVISDKTLNVTADLDIKLIDFTGNTLSEKRLPLDIPSLSSAIYYTFYPKENHDPAATVLVAALITAEGEQYRNCHFFVPPKNLLLPDALISTEISWEDEAAVVKLKSKNLARFVKLAADQEGNFEDNYFDLLPGEERKIMFLPVDKSEVLPLISVRSLGDI